MNQNTRKTLGFFWRHAVKFKIVLIGMVFGLLFAVFGDMTWALLYREFFDTLVTEGSKEAIGKALVTVLLWILAIEAVSWTGWRILHYSTNYFQTNVMANISRECFESMQKHSYRFFTNNFVGSLVKKINRIVRGFERVADVLWWDMAPMVLKLLAILGILVWVHPVLGAIMAVWTVIFVSVQYWLARYKLKYDLPRAAADSRVTASMADAISNNMNIKLFAGLRYELRKFMNVTRGWLKITKKAWDVNAHIESGQAVFMVMLELGMMYAGVKLWQKDLIVVADFMLLQLYLFEIFHQLWGFGRNLRNLYEALADSEEMTMVLNSPLEVKDKKGAKVLRTSSGKVEFNDVRFSYGPGESVLKGLSFKVKPGERIALIGPSGGGKSTIVSLLMRLFDIKGGEILIDGQNIADVTQDSLRKHIALVPQDPILFHRTLMENIKYGRREASDKEVFAAAKMAHCHEFIQKFPKKYETFVGERGVKLSGGQRQRVAIARAILSNARILVLDEATSSLDSESEGLIQEALGNLMKQKTTFIIAHRLSTIMSADRIFVLDGGKIVEEGQHADLVWKKSGLYKRLWDLQVGGYL